MRDAQINDSAMDESVAAAILCLDEKAEANEFDAKDADFVTVASRTYVRREEEHCHIYKPSVFTMIKNKIDSIVFRLKDGVLWQYEKYWEEMNEERYRTGDYDDNESEFIIEQKMINAREIVMGDCAINENDYPWHGYTFQEFKDLNDEMQASLDTVRNIKNKKEIKQFKRAHKKIFNAYFFRPIRVYLDTDGRMLFGGDGRHRIHVASIANGLIPVWIIKYQDPKTVSLDYFKTNYATGEWRFLNSLK